MGLPPSPVFCRFFLVFTSMFVCCMAPGFSQEAATRLYVPLCIPLLTGSLKFSLLLQVASHGLVDSAFWNPSQPQQYVKYVILFSFMAT